MKIILIATDFSAPAENAAKYALALAIALKADLLLCNAFKVPADAPLAAQVAWPLMDYGVIKKEVTSKLEALAKKLTALSALEDPQTHRPKIEYESEVGTVCDVVTNLANQRKIDLVVMGLSGAGGLAKFILGSSSKEMIEKASFPVLFIPFTAHYKEIRKIVFTTDLNEGDLEYIQFLTTLISDLSPEILIAHITNKEVDQKDKMQRKIDAFLNNVVSEIKYPKIKYEYVWNIDVGSGLEYITEQDNIDLVAIVHHRHHILGKIFKGSYTQKLSRHTELPLLVFPPFEHVISD
ncbi:nucleotide-binding universal stress UspA family protein [Pedobacter sp. CG_S7]|uniref:universal stress protein n=1 Tax=Pedobacter sp. CG_S7 TaxID=3143930 RepID=UPI00339A46F5